MNIPYFRNVRFFFGCKETEKQRDRRFLHWLIHYFLFRRLVREAVMRHSKRTGLKRMAFLLAHGKANASEFLYSDGGELKRVQDWIDTHDGKFNLLIICACNTGNYTIHSRHSIVIHLNRSMSQLEIMRLHSRYNTRVYVPQVGYVEQRPYQLKKLTNVQV